VDYAPGGAGVAIDAGLGVSDLSNATLAGATVAISAGFLAGDIGELREPRKIPQKVGPRRAGTERRRVARNLLLATELMGSSIATMVRRTARCRSAA
jgi:hypothetical protein